MKRILSHNISRSADKRPDSIAFKQLNNSISYEQLVYKSNCLANFLIELRVQKGDRVGIFMNRSFESGIGIYGILAAGAAYVPIDTNLPKHRILELLSDCDIEVLLTNGNYTGKLTEICQKEISLKHIIGINEPLSNDVNSFSWEQVMTSNDKTPSVNIVENDLAYIMYTSGTTGKPKGIVHTHYSGCSYAKLSAELYNVDHNDILGNHSHLHYDISTMGYLTLPYAGGCTVIIPEAYTIFPTSLGQLIASEKLTIWYSVPLALIQLLQANTLSDLDLSHLRWILFGGETFAIKHIQALFPFVPQARFSNVYGPAEVNQCTYYNFDIDTNLDQNLPLGKAWPETTLALAKNKNAEQEDFGELLVSSSTRMKGYWNQGELTQSKLVSKLDQNGKAIDYYKTGDLAKILPNGDYLFLGRSDRQVKVRGYRVELSEVENVLLSHDAVLETAVYAKKEGDANVVYADIVLQDESNPPIDFGKYLSNFLPVYAIPQEFKTITKIPRTSAGKVDYKLLTT